MNVLDALNILIHVIFVAIGVQSLVDFLRYRDAMRRDAAILFSILALLFLIQLIAIIQGTQVSTIGNSIVITALILEPYLLLRLVRYLRYMPANRVRFALYSLIGTVVVGILLGPRVPLISTIVSQGYLIGFNVYAMIGFVRGAIHSTGVAQQRLRLAALGSCLFALIFIVVLVANVLPQQRDLLLLLVELVALLCVMAFYLGFAPPRWLRRIWQFAETDHYLAQINRKSIDASVQSAQITADLCRVASRAVGGIAAGIVQLDETSKRWIVTYTDVVAPISWNDATAFTLNWDGALPRYLRTSKKLGVEERHLLEAVGADTLLMTPITTTKGIWGLLLVFLRFGSLFIDDDLHFLMRITEQSAIVLENSELIENLRHHAERLEEQAAHLTAANRELDAFSYSVSHDLRAPLRAVDGFSQALLEDYDNALDDIGRDYLHRIRTESQRMGELIDDLIGLSRLSRIELTTREIDLSALVREIAADLAAKEPHRTVEFSIQNHLTAIADERLLRVAFQNLLGNAWKFTAKQTQARIEFGCTHEAQTLEFFVRDNGAGFDMAYANKLFGPFQRLHSMEEFTGTGIGLATVQRIMHRHGGTVRAEGAVGVGAAFFIQFEVSNRPTAEGANHESDLVSRRQSQ